MLETIAMDAIAAAVSLSLNVECEVSVHTNGSPARRGKAAAARCIGGDGRLYRVAFDGWGPGFERTRTVVALMIDLRWDVDALVVSVMNQAAPIIAEQNRRRVRAAALGIPAPMDPEAFADEIRMPSLRRLDARHAYFMATRMLLGTPLEGRLIVASSAWSRDEAVRTDAHGRRGPLVPSSIDFSEIGEWRFLLERRLVRFIKPQS